MEGRKKNVKLDLRNSLTLYVHSSQYHLTFVYIDNSKEKIHEIFKIHFNTLFVFSIFQYYFNNINFLLCLYF